MYEHHGLTKSLYKAAESFKVNSARFEDEIKQYEFKNTVIPQCDTCLCYFESNKDKAFGFYYNGAIQFLCPYENFIDIQIDDRGTNVLHILYFNKEGISCEYKLSVPTARIAPYYKSGN